MLNVYAICSRPWFMPVAGIVLQIVIFVQADLRLRAQEYANTSQERISPQK